ncbi:MAG: cation transporter, partial [Clostridia bacterium]|nr:cation transporter [Clostridia bacterium]
MIELTIEVEGMKCGMCESHVNDVVRRVSGVKKVN